MSLLLLFTSVVIGGTPPRAAAVTVRAPKPTVTVTKPVPQVTVR